MQITIEVTDARVDFVLELLKSLPFVDIQQNPLPAERNLAVGNESFSPKTTQLLGSFPQMADYADIKVRQQAIHTKHIR